MRLGLSMLFCLNKPFNTLVKYLSKINLNVEHVEIVDEGAHTLNSRRVNVLKEIFREKGLSLSVHAPFANINIASPSPTIRHASLKRLKQSIMFSAQLNPECWVFHPGLQNSAGGSRSLCWKLNLRGVKELLKSARKFGVNIAIENVPDPFPFLLKSINDFRRFYEELGECAYGLGLTFDVGHANINEQIDDFLENFSDKIVHVHVHDNFGENDSHLGIGYGNINWRRFLNMLKKINYEGALVIESVRNVEESIRRLKNLLES